MTIWEGEIKELDKLYLTFKGHLPDIVKELEQLIRTDDPNVVMLYSRRCLEVIITDLCETELNRPRKTEPLKGIIDKLNSEEKVPAHIITSMHGLNSMANYGAHPKDFDPEQVKPVLNNLAIIIKWYLKHKDFQIVSKTEIKEEKGEPRGEKPSPAEEKKEEKKEQRSNPPVKNRAGKGRRILVAGFLVIVFAFLIVSTLITRSRYRDEVRNMTIEAYRTVQIGDQTWMAENLRTTLFNDGTPIPLVKDEKEWEQTTTPAYCWYENDKKKYAATYGALYNWHAVNSGNLCPVGWHVPTEEDWTTLTTFLGDSLYFFEGELIPAHKEWKEITGFSGDSLEFGSVEADRSQMIPRVSGIKLKAAGNDYWPAYDIKEDFAAGSPFTFWVTDENGIDTLWVTNYIDFDTVFSTDEYGFTALPGGFRSVYGAFFDMGVQGNWWSSTEEVLGDRDAKDRQLHHNSNELVDLHQYKETGMSVRCVKDK